MTSPQLVARALNRLAKGLSRSEATVLRGQLHLLIPDALRLLPEKVRELGPEDAEVYRKNFSVTLINGSGSLVTATGLTTEPMIPTDITKVVHADVISETNKRGQLRRLASESLLDLEQSTEFAYFAIEDNTLYTMMNNDRTALDGTATVRAGFVPLITSVRRSHETLLVGALIELAQGKIVEEVAV